MNDRKQNCYIRNKIGNLMLRSIKNLAEIVKLS